MTYDNKTVAELIGEAFDEAIEEIRTFSDKQFNIADNI